MRNKQHVTHQWVLNTLDIATVITWLESVEFRCHVGSQKMGKGRLHVHFTDPQAAISSRSLIATSLSQMEKSRVCIGFHKWDY